MRQPTYAHFPTAEYAARYARLRQTLDRNGLDGLIVTGKENVVYFTGLQTIGWDSKHRPLAAILPRDREHPVLVIPESLVVVAQESSWIEDVRVWGGTRFPEAPRDPVAAIVRAAQDVGLDRGRVGMELGYGQRLAMPQADYEAIRAGLSAMRVADGSAAIWALRMIKSPLEIECLRRAAEATSRAFEAGFRALRAGMTERELAAVFFGAMSATGYRPGFVMIRSGPLKYRMINVEPFDKPMRPGELVVVDLGATYRYYWSDFMRMASIGEPTKDQRAFFECELAAQQAGVDAIRPGVPARDVFLAAKRVIDEMGFGRHAAIERIGHGVGLDVHEPPSIGFDSETIVEPGMVLTSEPIFWDQPDGVIGNFALEDMVVVTETGGEVISAFPKSLRVA